MIVDPAQLAAFSGIWFAAAAAPGGNTAFTVAVSSRYGFSAGIIGALGFVSVLYAYLVLVAFGVGFAVTQYRPALDALRWLGVGYLLYLAWRMWLAEPAGRAGHEFESVSLLRIYALGSLVCFTNPKVIIFMAVVLPQSVDAARPLVSQLLVLGSVGALLSLLAHSVYSFFGHTLGRSVPRLARDA